MNRPQYINWIVKEDGVVVEDQQPLNCYKLSYEIDDAILDDWALHIRRHYVPDDELREDSALHRLTVEEYLRQYVIPQKGEPFGPTARSNDISEVLFADLFEFVLNYEVPRCKQYNRSGKNESEHGTDVIAYRFYTERKEPNKNDELVAVEVKARFLQLRHAQPLKTQLLIQKKMSTGFRILWTTIERNFVLWERVQKLLTLQDFSRKQNTLIKYPMWVLPFQACRLLKRK